MGGRENKSCLVRPRRNSCFNLSLLQFNKKGDDTTGTIDHVTNQNDGPIREHFVFTDTDGVVYHLMVEGTDFKLYSNNL